MNRRHYSQYSYKLNRDMNMLIYGDTGIPMIAFPCQDGKCDNWEGFQMPDTIGDYIDSGKVQLFCVDAVDEESWSDVNGDKGHRAWIQEMYYQYIVEEALPLIKAINGTGIEPITTGCSLGATHAAILFFRRPDLFQGVMAFSGSYSVKDFWDGWMDQTAYDNSPLDFIKNMPNDHYYIDLYNKRKIVLCVGQGAWEGTCLTTTKEMQEVFHQKGIHGWVDIWGYDVNHDWPWWKKQIRYHMPDFVE